MPSCNVRVVCRFRPINQREKDEQAKMEEAGFKLVFEGETDVTLVNGKQSASFSFDRIFPPDSNQIDVYNVTARPTIEDVLSGYNGTIFAYGQTGAGKTFTMFGPDPEFMTLETRGIIPRTSAHIFSHIDGDNSKREYAIKCSFVEIYKEVLKDLLGGKTELKIRESPQKGVWIDGVVEEFVTSEQDISDLITIGDNAKSVTATQMNARSSRSHSLFIITIEQKNEDGSTKVGKLNLVDLAGSEKIGKTGAKGNTLEEAKKINQSLSSLGNCIHALTESNRGHIPFRDSTLTRILQESLGGNTKTTLLIACSPHQFNAEETLGTLQFGKRAKTIKNTVKVNQQKSASELAALIATLRKELNSLLTYTTSLEKQIEYIQIHGFDPNKASPFPNGATPPPSSSPNLGQSIVPTANPPINKLTSSMNEGVRQRSPSTPVLRSSTNKIPDLSSSPISRSPHLSPRVDSRSSSPIAGIPASLEQVQEELENFKKSKETETLILAKELEELTMEDDSVCSKIETLKEKIKLAQIQKDNLLKEMENNKRVHKKTIEFTQKEINEREQDLLDLGNHLSEMIQQNVDMEYSLKQAEEFISVLYIDNRIQSRECYTQSLEYSKIKESHNQTQRSHAIAKEDAAQLTNEFATLRNQCIEKETLQKDIAEKIISTQEKEKEIKENMARDKGTLEFIEQNKKLLLEINLSDVEKLVQETQSQAEKILERKSQAENQHLQRIRESKERCIHTLSQALVLSKKIGLSTDGIYSKLKDLGLSSKQIDEILSQPFDQEQTTRDVLLSLQTHKDKVESEIKSSLDNLEKWIEIQKNTVQEAEKKKKEIFALKEQTMVENSELKKSLEGQVVTNTNVRLNKLSNVGRTQTEQNLMRLISSQNLSQTLQELLESTESLRLQCEQSRQAGKNSKYKADELETYSKNILSRIGGEEENVLQLEATLNKETKRAGAETITASLAQKRVDNNNKKITGFEEEVNQLEFSNSQLSSEQEALEAEVRELEEAIREEEELLVQAEIELEEQKRLRQEQLKRNRKMYKPVQKRGVSAIARAMEEKIDLQETRTKLRATGSNFLKEAAREHERSLKSRV